MSDVFSREFHVRWSDLDPNQHMRHSAFADLCAATRIYYLEDMGFSMKSFAEMQLGPILFSENLTYFKEVLPGDRVSVNVRMGGLSEDGRKWKMSQEIHRLSDGALSARCEILGAWFDLSQRKLTRPPENLKGVMAEVPRTENFEKL